MAKSIFGRGWVKDVIIVAIGVLIIWMGLRVVFGTENPFYVVSSGSMVPELQVFDVLVVQGNDPFEAVQVGDVIVFNRPAGQDRVIVHRVASIINDDPLTIRTKGDANPASIPGTDFPITEEEYIGKVAYVIPQVGYVTRILTPPINYIIIAIIIGIMIFKQITKSKKESELSDSFTFDQDKDSKSDNSSDEKIDELPEDKEYTSQKEPNPNDTNDEEKESTTKNDTQDDDKKLDSKKKKPDEES